MRTTQRHCVNGGPLMKMLTRCFLNTGFKRRVAVFFDSHWDEGHPLIVCGLAGREVESDSRYDEGSAAALMIKTVFLHQKLPFFSTLIFGLATVLFINKCGHSGGRPDSLSSVILNPVCLFCIRLRCWLKWCFNSRSFREMCKSAHKEPLVEAPGGNLVSQPPN